MRLRPLRLLQILVIRLTLTERLDALGIQRAPKGHKQEPQRLELWAVLEYQTIHRTIGFETPAVQKGRRLLPTPSVQRFLSCHLNARSRWSESDTRLLEPLCLPAYGCSMKTTRTSPQSLIEKCGYPAGPRFCFVLLER
jgi:hypothetical protein